MFNLDLLSTIESTLAAVGPGFDCANLISATEVGFLDIGKILEVFIIALILIAGLYVFIQLALGGIQYISSGGDKVHTQAARERISYAILGLVIVVATVALTQILGSVFGVNILGAIKFPGAQKIVGQTNSCT